jgi:nucleoid DNA-binding protein
MANEKAAPMNRADIAGAIAAKFEISQKQADEITREYEAAIVRAVAGGQEVRLNGFGSFKVQDRQARMARNPRTGEQQQVAAKKVPKFVASKVMKDSVMGAGSGAATAAATTKDGKAAKSSAAGGTAAKAPAKKAAAKKK